KSGVGATIETSLFEVAMHLQASTWADYLVGAPEPTRMGAGQPHNAPAAEVIPTRDGHIVLSAYADDHWQRLCRVLGRDDLAGDERFSSNERRVAHRSELRAVLRECLSGRSSEECVALLTRHRIVVGAVRSYSQVLESADLASSGLVVDAMGPDQRSYRALTLPYRFDDAPRPAPPAAPACGADSDALLAEVGFSPDEIAALRRSGAVA
ncbi:MAG: CoA transferase, partial [Ideonella sp.]|nr:CoA transferase [Ideonella sp.]